MRKGGVEVTEASKVSSKASGLCGQAGLSPSVGQGGIFLTVIAPLETDMLIYPLHPGSLLPQDCELVLGVGRTRIHDQDKGPLA